MSDVRISIAIDSQSAESGARRVNSALKDMDHTSGKANRGIDKLNKTLKTIGSRAKDMFTLKNALGVVAGATGLGYMAKRSLDAADSIAKTADAIGVTTDTLQEYRYIAERSGVSTEQLEAGLGAFSKRLGELRSGTGALNTLLNKHNEELKNQLIAARSTSDALDIYFAALQKVEDQSDRNALSSAAFSRTAGIAMTNMVDNVDVLRERYERLGIIIDEKLLRNAESAKDAIDDVSLVISQSFTKAVLELAPEIEQAAANMAVWVGENKEFLTQDIPGYVESMVGALGGLKSIYDDIPEDIRGGMGVVGALLFGKKAAFIVAGLQLAPAIANSVRGFAAAFKGELDWLEFATMNAEELAEALDKIGRTEGPYFEKKIEWPEVSDATAPIRVIAPETDELDTAFLKVKESLEEQRKQISMTEREWDKYQAILKAGIDPTSAQAAEIEKLVDSIHDLQELDELEASFLGVKESLEEQRMQLTMTEREWDKYRAVMEAGVDPTSARAEELRQLVDALHDIKEAQREVIEQDEIVRNEMTIGWRDVTSTMEIAFDGWARSYSRELNDMLWDAELTFDGILESFGRMITEMMIQAAMTDIVGALFGKSSGIGGLLGGIVSGIGGLFGGGAASAPATVIAHSGGVIGLDRLPRYHNGLMPNEMPAILQKGEGVFTKGQMEALGAKAAEPRTTNNYFVISSPDAEGFDRLCQRNAISIVKATNIALEKNVGRKQMRGLLGG